MLTSDYVPDFSLIIWQPRSQGHFPGLGADFPAPPPSKGKDPGNEVDYLAKIRSYLQFSFWISIALAEINFFPHGVIWLKYTFSFSRNHP